MRVSEENNYQVDVYLINRRKLSVNFNKSQRNYLFSENALDALGCKLKILTSGIKTIEEYVKFIRFLHNSEVYHLQRVGNTVLVNYAPDKIPTPHAISLAHVQNTGEDLDTLLEDQEDIEELPDLHPEEEEMEKGCPRKKRSTTMLDIKPILSVIPDGRIDDKIDGDLDSFNKYD